MSRRNAQKRIHYVRAVYGNPGAAPQNLEAHIRAALVALPRMNDTQLVYPLLGTLAVTMRDVADPHFALFSLGAAAPNELMATMGFNVEADADHDLPVAPIAGRGWKSAEAFVLVDDNDVLVCTHGEMSIRVVEWYLRHLLGQAGAAAEAQGFGLVARTARQSLRTLEAEGLREIRLASTAYAATEIVDGIAGGNWLEKGWQQFLSGVREAFESEARDDAEREIMINHLAELHISAVVAVKGGVRGEPTMLRSLADMGREALTDGPDDTDITLVTRKGNPITASSLTMGTTKSIRRRANQNSLDVTDAWIKLAAYRAELVFSGRWRE